ncbi:hypothetical protein A2111_02755 [Candidatus Daviesbacteria bacterium GWA1_38_6]|nr:MAG: hypothetical protein A2111_02755 [Candidatus Daviesbacteria bacterium GWA1_38_6]
MHYINLPSQQFNVHKRRSSRYLRRITPMLIIIGFLVGLGIVFALFKTPASFNYSFKLPFVGYPFSTTDDKVNVLLLGNAGGRHDGSKLTDTIMVASYNLRENRVVFISLPRDLWVESLKMKINAAYEIGDEKDEGLKFAKEIVADILGIPIHYGVRVDFSGFEKAIDEVGGINIDIERSFDDYNYPIEGKEDDLCGWAEEEREFNESDAKALNIEKGKLKVLISPEGKIATDSAEPEKGLEYFTCRYEQISFQKGLVTMDGETALKFVRSRMGTNGEGSDFARSKRQQKVLEAFRGKMLSFETFVNPIKLKNLLDTFGESVETDMPVDGAISIYGMSKGVRESRSFVITNSGKDALLLNPPLSDYGGAWVLIPKEKNYDKIHEFVLKTLNWEIINEATSSARTGNN